MTTVLSQPGRVETGVVAKPGSRSRQDGRGDQFWDKHWGRCMIQQAEGEGHETAGHKEGKERERRWGKRNKGRGSTGKMSLYFQLL